MNLNTETELRETQLPQNATTRRETSLTQTENPDYCDSTKLLLVVIMVKEEEIMADAGGVGRGYMDLLGLGEDDYLLCLPPSSYFASSSVVSATTTTAAAPSPTCASYLDLAPAYYHHMLSFAGQEQQQYHGDGGVLGFQYLGDVADHAIPTAVPQKFSPPTTECSSSISSMSSSPPATAVSAVSCSKPQAFKKKGSRSSEQRKAASAAATGDPAVAAGATTNKRPKVRREKLGERIIALQQLVSPFGKSDTASVLHEALGYIRFLHDQVQVLSSPYMQRQPASAHVPESAAGTVVEPPTPRASDLRSRGLCLVPVSCTEHLAGNTHGGNGADLWSVAAGMAKAAAAAAADNKGPAGGMLLGGGGHGRQGHLA